MKKYEYSTKALRIYAQIERTSFVSMAEAVGMNNRSFYRYVCGERKPDIDTLVHICNTLRISIGNFFIKPGQEIFTVRIYAPEEFQPIKFMPEKIEQIREDMNLSKRQLFKRTDEVGESGITNITYNKLINGESFGYEFVLAMLNAFELDLSTLFDDAQLLTADDRGDMVMVSRNTLSDLRKHITHLECKNRVLRDKNASLNQIDSEISPYAFSRIRAIIKKLDKLSDELRSLLPEDSQPKEYILPEESQTMKAAEDKQDTYHTK